ncbi:MAG: TMEM165/GDT1 family protein [Desulfobacterales bacterium]|jgi:putative Ca2+/H+ antiporter (TMEM165/GDT1 family)
MDFKIMLVTFGIVFLAELGDRTRLATFCLSADCDPKISVFIGSAAALILSASIAVFLGAAISRLIPAHYTNISAGVFFLVAGVLTLISAMRAIPSWSSLDFDSVVPHKTSR